MKSKRETILILQFSRPLEVVKNQICEAPCRIKNLMGGVKVLVSSVLNERGKGIQSKLASEPGLGVQPNQISLRGVRTQGTFKVRLNAPPSSTLTVGVIQKPKGILTIRPKEIIFTKLGPLSKGKGQFIKNKIEYCERVQPYFKSNKTNDMNYAFVSDVKTRVLISGIKVKEDIILLNRHSKDLQDQSLKVRIGVSFV